jgi:hypothetical protein
VLASLEVLRELYAMPRAKEFGELVPRQPVANPIPRRNELYKDVLVRLDLRVSVEKARRDLEPLTLRMSRRSRATALAAEARSISRRAVQERRVVASDQLAT